MEKLTRQNLRESERQNYHLKQRLLDAELQIAEQAKLIESVYEDFDAEGEEVWADVIDDR
jgi:hypothetical protein